MTSPHRPSVWGQVLWPVGSLAQGQLNTCCQQLLGLFTEALSVSDSSARVSTQIKTLRVLEVLVVVLGQ